MLQPQSSTDMDLDRPLPPLRADHMYQFDQITSLIRARHAENDALASRLVSRGEEIEEHGAIMAGPWRDVRDEAIE